MAVKQIQIPAPGSTDFNERTQDAIQALQREIDVMRLLDHPNIVRYLGTEMTDGEAFVRFFFLSCYVRFCVVCVMLILMRFCVCDIT